MPRRRDGRMVGDRTAPRHRPSAASPPTTTPACTPRCSPRSPPRTAATRSPTARTTTPSACSRSSPSTSARASRRSPCSTARARTSPGCSRCCRAGARSISASTAHINSDEGGAPERVGGIKLLTVPTPDGKLTPELIDREAWGWGDEHRAQPLVVSITQTTELGTAYTVEEIRAIADHVHERGMKLHLDGARLSNAAASLGLPAPRVHARRRRRRAELRRHQERRVLGEAIVVLNPEASEGLKYLRKLNMQLASKMRFVSAQLIALLEGDLWLRSASHANAMARAPARRARRAASPRAICPASASRSRRSRTACSRCCRPASPTGCASALPLLRLGCRDAARCAGCARSTRREADIDAFVAGIREELAREPARRRRTMAARCA